MSLPSHIRIVPDLSLLICPPNPNQWETDFYILYSTVFMQHDKKVKELRERILELREYGYQCEVAWALSDELKVQLYNEFPWNAINEIPWVRDMMLTFPGWVEAVESILVEHDSNAKIEPDIVPSHVKDETKQAWLDVLVAGMQNTTDLSRITSYPEQETVQLRVLFYDDDSEEYEVKLIRRITEWDAVRQQLDPWFVEGLPWHGEYPYRPDNWISGKPFPKRNSRRGPGFLDKHQQIWVWDRAEHHWDVQERRQGFGKYFRVSSDGRLLD
ncbi:MAG TPA: hypothetical protein ENI48_01935 [Thioploca sp.]|nr:hypothetical protein [Thioploca sp.]